MFLFNEFMVFLDFSGMIFISKSLGVANVKIILFYHWIVCIYYL